MEEGGFAGAGGAHEGDEFAAGDGQVDGFEGEDLNLAAFEGFGEVVGLDDWFRAWGPRDWSVVSGQ